MNMEVHFRNRSVSVAYLHPACAFDGSIAYFFLLSGSEFFSARSFLERFRVPTRSDLITMKRPLLMSRPGDRVYAAVGRGDEAVFRKNEAFVRGLYEKAGILCGDMTPVRGDAYRHMRSATARFAVSTLTYSRAIDRIFRSPGLMQAVRVLNNKASAMAYLRDRGIELPSFINLPRGSSVREMVRGIHRIKLPFYLKRAIGAGGSAVWHIKDAPQLAAFSRRLRFGAFQMQEALPGEDSFNVQYLVRPDRTERILVTRQRIRNETIHVGNDWPVDWDPGPYADGIAEACRGLGYLGVLGLDMKDKLIEVNARQNSSGVMQVLLERLPGIKKLTLSIYHSKRRRLLADLGLDHLWYRAGKGILPYGWHDRAGQMHVMIVNDLDGSLESEFARLCPQVV